MVRVPVVPCSGPGRLGPVPPPEEVGGRPSETSRNPCEGTRISARCAAVRGLTVRDEKPRFAPSRAAVVLRVASFMLPLTQQRYFEVYSSRPAAVTAREGVSFGHAALPFNTYQAGSPDGRLALSATREPAGVRGQVRFSNGRQNVDRRDPPGGDPGRCATRQSCRGIRLRERQPQAASR